MEDLFEKKEVDKCINKDRVMFETGFDMFFPGIDRAHKQKIRHRTNRKYGQAKKCSGCGSVFRVQHHHKIEVIE